MKVSISCPFSRLRAKESSLGPDVSGVYDLAARCDTAANRLSEMSVKELEDIERNVSFILVATLLVFFSVTMSF